MYAFFLTLFVLVCLVLMVVVLLQSSKGGGLAGAFGGGSSDSSLLGGRGAATFLGKLTVYLAVGFMTLALLLAILSSRSAGVRRESVINERREAGNLTIPQADEQSSIYDEIQTEGFDGQGQGQPAEDGQGATQPAPAGP